MFVLVILLCLGGGIAFVVWYFKTSNPIREPVVLANDAQPAAGQRGGGREFRGPPAEGRRARPDEGARNDSVIRFLGRQDGVSRWRVTGQGITMTVSQRDGQPPRFSFRYAGGNNLLNDEQRQIASLRWRVLRDRSVAEHLKITDEQMARLRELPVSNDLVVSEADVNQIREIWATIQPTERNRQAEQQILGLLRRISTSARQPTQENWTQQIARIREVLTDEQIAAFAAMGDSPQRQGGG